VTGRIAAQPQTYSNVDHFRRAVIDMAPEVVTPEPEMERRTFVNHSIDGADGTTREL
jgi:hypothetical protein